MRSVWYLLTLCGISSSLPHSPFPYFPHTHPHPQILPASPLYSPHPTSFSRSAVLSPQFGNLSPQFGRLDPSGFSRPVVPSPQYGYLHPIQNLHHTSNQDSSGLARSNIPSSLSVTYPTQPGSSHSLPVKFPRIHWLNSVPVYDPTFHVGSIKFARTLLPGEGQLHQLVPRGQGQSHQIDQSVEKSTLDNLQSRTTEDLQNGRIDQEQMSHQQNVGRSFFYVPPKTTKKAVVHLVEADGSKVTGNLEVFQVVAPFGVSLGVKIVGNILGLKQGSHGFHVHTDSATTNNCLDAGGHFNPENTQHGPHSILDQSFSYDWFGQRHAGDLGNVVTENDGTDTRVRKYDKYLKLGDGSTKDINNRVIVVHADQDDGSQDNNGNAGKRVACGIIKLIQ